MSRSKQLLSSLLQLLRLVTIEPYLFFVFFGYTVRLVTFQNLLQDRACRNLLSYPADVCDRLDDHADQRASAIELGNNLYAGVTLVSSLPAVALAVFLGPWSDKYSRKYPMVLSASGLLAEGVISAVLTTHGSLSPWWFVAVHAFNGMTGGLIMSMAAGFSYLSDVTKERSRATRYAVLESTNISAMVMGSLVGGQIFKVGGHLPVMLLSPCSFALAIGYTALFVRETKTRTADQTWSVMAKDLATVENIKMSLKTCCRRREGNIRLQICLILWASFMHTFIDMGTLAVTYPYTRQMYSWDVPTYTSASVAYYLVNAVLTVSVVPVLSMKLHLQEATLGLIGVLALTSKMAIISAAHTEVLFYVGWMSGTINNSANIAFRARMANLVDKDELGRIFSLLGICDSLTPLLGTLAFVQMYNASSSVFPGMPYAVSAVLLIPSMIIFCWMMKQPEVKVDKSSKTEESDAKVMETVLSHSMKPPIMEVKAQ